MTSNTSASGNYDKFKSSLNRVDPAELEILQAFGVAIPPEANVMRDTAIRIQTMANQLMEGIDFVYLPPFELEMAIEEAIKEVEKSQKKVNDQEDSQVNQKSKNESTETSELYDVNSGALEEDSISKSEDSDEDLDADEPLEIDPNLKGLTREEQFKRITIQRRGAITQTHVLFNPKLEFEKSKETAPLADERVHGSAYDKTGKKGLNLEEYCEKAFQLFEETEYQIKNSNDLKNLIHLKKAIERKSDQQILNETLFSYYSPEEADRILKNAQFLIDHLNDSIENYIKDNINSLSKISPESWQKSRDIELLGDQLNFLEFVQKNLKYIFPKENEYNHFKNKIDGFIKNLVNINWSEKIEKEESQILKLPYDLSNRAEHGRILFKLKQTFRWLGALDALLKLHLLSSDIEEKKEIDLLENQDNRIREVLGTYIEQLMQNLKNKNIDKYDRIYLESMEIIEKHAKLLNL